MAVTDVIKVLVVVDHPVVLAGVCGLAARQLGFDVYEAKDARTGLSVYQEVSPRVVVVDINLPDLSGLELVRQLRKADPASNILVLSIHNDPEFVAEALRWSANGYVSKNDDPRQIVEAIRSLAAGRTWLPPSMAERLAFMQARTAEAQRGFSKRELKILRLLSDGMTMQETAAAIGFSYKTTASICNGIRERLGARTAAEMIKLALEGGLI